MGRLVALLLLVGVTIYLTMGLLDSPEQNGQPDATIIDKPAETRRDVNQALDNAEKSREEALEKSK